MIQVAKVVDALKISTTVECRLNFQNFYDLEEDNHALEFETIKIVCISGTHNTRFNLTNGAEPVCRLSEC